MSQNSIWSRYFHWRNGIGALMVGACLLASLLLASFGGTTTAVAQNGQVGRSAWCVDMASLGGYLDCSYNTYAQCAAAARGVTNICMANSYYVPKPPQRPRRDPRR